MVDSFLKTDNNWQNHGSQRTPSENTHTQTKQNQTKI